MSKSTKHKLNGSPHNADVRGRFLCILFVCFVLLFSISPVSFAGSSSTSGALIEENIDENPTETMPEFVVPADFTHGFNFTIYCWYESVYSGQLMLTGLGGGSSSVENYINLTTEDPDNILYKAWSALESCYGVISAIGMSVLIMYFFIEMIEKSTSDNFNADHFIRMLLKLGIGMIVIRLGPDLIKNLANFGSALYTDVSTAAVIGSGGVATSNIVLKNAYFKLKDCGIWDGIGYMLAIITPSLLVTLSKIGFTAVAMGRVIELAVRMLFAPIGMANLYSGGTNAPGIRYMKKLLAVALQGVLLFAIILIYPILLATGTNLIKSVAMSFVAIGAAAKSQTIANDIIGV